MAQKFLGQAGVSQLWSKIKSLLTSKGVGGIVTATSTDGVTYTATVDGVTALTAGLTLTIVPDKASTSVSTKLNVNGLGDKYIRQSTTNSTATGLTPKNTSWLAANKPITIQYDGTQWKTVASRTNASDMNGTVAIANGGTGANNIEDALLNLGIGTASASTFGLLTVADETDETDCQCEDAAITPKALYNLSAYRQVNTAYAVGDKVNVPYQAGLIMECTQAGTTASTTLDTTSITVGQVIVDGGVKWTVKNIGSGDFLPLTGGNVTGDLTVQDKTVVRSVNGNEADSNGNVQIDAFPYDIQEKSTYIFITDNIAICSGYTQISSSGTTVVLPLTPKKIIFATFVDVAKDYPRSYGVLWSDINGTGCLPSTLNFYSSDNNVGYCRYFAIIEVE